MKPSPLLKVKGMDRYVTGEKCIGYTFHENASVWVKRRVYVCQLSVNGLRLYILIATKLVAQQQRGADGLKIAVLRKGRTSLEIFRAAAHRKR